ncbi:hypothetical protein MIND_01249200 [Mycena indigotica]|uniref:Uncharacterized protein n=1 Tax=Mycena indigotica TaxID=2126181 RepID=A0A8H6VW12_9AGAR|nr:uncharacterized protein MIND_01249200 [Mycena indigotica]KAF7292218.1 hypothetical protein MIND_01249200 [Mycena indigotica]
MENTPPGPARLPTRPQDELPLEHRLSEFQTPDARRVDTGETRISKRALGELRNDVRRGEDMRENDGQSKLEKPGKDNRMRGEGLGAVTVASLRERLQDSLEDNAGLKSRTFCCAGRDTCHVQPAGPNNQHASRGKQVVGGARRPKDPSCRP